VVGVSTIHPRRRPLGRQSCLRGILRWGLALSLLAGGAAIAVDRLPPQASDRIIVEQRTNVLELSWSDTEERLQGAIQPDPPIAGQPLQVLLNVGSFEGAAFEGPLTITLREAGATHGQVQTVKKGAVNWVATFTPERAGPYLLDVSFRTTRLKVLHASLQVSPSPVPRAVLWAMVGLAALVTLGYGLRSLLRRETSTEPHPVLAELSAQPPPTPAVADAAPSPAGVPADPPPAPAVSLEKEPAASLEKEPAVSLEKETKL
jgi:hypothetical protein